MSESPNHVIQLTEVDVYQASNIVLKGVNLTIDEGEFSYLVGETGSGKSSLLKILYGELNIFAGHGEVAGFNLNKIKSKEIPYLRRKIGIVFQDFQLLTDRSIGENLKFVLKATGWKKKSEINNRIEHVMNLVGLKESIQKMPHQLSGGEQQRVVIGRALLNNPEIILADEPTGNLDPKTSNEIVTLLKQISAEGTAVLMATHDYQVIQKFPARLIRCKDGLITEEKLTV